MISQIKLHNFKAFDDELFNIKPFTLMAGINGMGKSSLIQSLLLLRQSSELGEMSSNVGDLRLRGDRVNLENVGRLKNSSADDNDIIIDITDDQNLEYKWILDAVDPTADKIHYTFEGGNKNKLSLFEDGFISLLADRISPQESYGKSPKTIIKTKFGVSGELAPYYLLNALDNNEDIGMKEMKADSAEDLGLIINLNAWLSKIMGLGLKTSAEEIPTSNSVRLNFTTEGSDGEKYSALQVGFGYSYSLPIILSLLTAKPGDLLIFENPEAHLHPYAQVQLGLMMAQAVKYGVQILVETHSDHIINSLRYARKTGLLTEDQVNMIFMYKEHTHDKIYNCTTEISIDDKGKLSDDPKMFYDTWDDMLTKLI